MRFDLGTVPAVASAVVALAALLLSGLALAASRRSAAASETSAETARQALALATEARWTLTRAGNALLLTNAGREPAYAVKVGADWISPPMTSDVIAGGEAVKFIDTRAIHDDNMVTVTWHASPDLSDSERRWRHPVVG